MSYAPDCGKAKAFAQCLQYTYIRVLCDECSGTAAFCGEIDICFIDDDDAFESFVFEECADRRKGDERASGITRRAKEDEFDRGVSVNSFLHLSFAHNSA